MDLISKIVSSTDKYIADMPKKSRKKIGQFFTSKESALFMASLFDLDVFEEEISFLDPGAGTGILTAALVQKIVEIGRIKKVNITCYENNKDIIDILKTNLQFMQENCDITIEYKINEHNYITSQSSEYNNALFIEEKTNKYDIVICNPPYMKIGKNAAEALSMADICYGTPNMYFLFLAMAVFNLHDNGELVFIIPRSWTSGAYFKRFREKFLSQATLKNIHLFESREKVFSKESVLQETIIIKAQKTKNKHEKIIITTTNNNFDFDHKTIIEVPYDVIVSSKNNYIYLLTNQAEINLVQKIHKWENTLLTIGMRMKTGLTVDFRNKELLRDSLEDDTVPLFHSQHIKNGKIEFPIGKKNEFIVNKNKGLLQDNVNYLFVKRFTSKEEERRLQCAIYLSNEYSSYKKISTHNKVNFITGKNPLSKECVFGLYVLFNSTVYDVYYRILNGSTQVNSTEINSIPVPTVTEIELIGRILIDSGDLSVKNCDNILRRYSDV